VRQGDSCRIHDRDIEDAEVPHFNVMWESSPRQKAGIWLPDCGHEQTLTVRRRDYGSVGSGRQDLGSWTFSLRPKIEEDDMRCGVILEECFVVVILEQVLMRTRC